MFLLNVFPFLFSLYEVLRLFVVRRFEVLRGRRWASWVPAIQTPVLRKMSAPLTEEAASSPSTGGHLVGS